MAMNFEQDMAIDENALDVEWLGQARLALKYGQHAAEMKVLLERAREALDVTKAKLSKKVRTKPAKYGIQGRLTEALVQNTIALRPAYQARAKDYIDAKYEYDMAMVAVRAIDQRKTSLENLVRLHLAAYFAGPSVPRDLTKEWEKREHQKKANATIKFKRKK